MTPLITARPPVILPPRSVASSSLVSLLHMRAETQGDDEAYVFLADGEQETGRLTYGALWDRATALAGFLAARDCRNAPVLLLMPSSIEFLIGLYGCLIAGAVAIPAPPPHRTRGMERIRSIIADARPRLILAAQAAPTGADGEPDPDLADIPWFEVEQVLAEEPRRAAPLPALAGDQPAVLQYTSGSTGSPKGIVITHDNAYANILGQQQTTGDPDAASLVSWLPVHHDMGLFGNIMAAPVLGGRLAFMPPGAFIQKPARWLRAISHYGAVRSGGPNFAYDLCTRTITAEQMEGVDLRGWHTAFNGAEPVRAATLQQFAQKFAPYGFQAEAWFACYGLAETTLIVSGARRRRPPTVRTYARDQLGEGQAVPMADATQPTQTLVSSGQSVPDHAVRIIDRATGRSLGPREIGEIWVAGPSVSSGFWRGAEASAQRFGRQVAGEDGKFVSTGDLGFFDDDELFIVSRLDDLIVLRGRNIAPQDIEDAAIRSGTGQVQTAAAFLEQEGEGDRVVLVMEVSRDLRRQDQLEAVSQAARDAVWQATEVALARLVLVRPGTIPRTTSGKVRRRSTRAGLAAGEFKSVLDQAAAAAPAEPVAAEGAEAEISAWLQRALVLNAPPSANAPLHRLGLDSLRTIEFSEWLRTTHGVQLSLADLMGGLTLTDVVAAVRHGGSTPQAVTTITAPARAHYPLTRTQEAIWAEQSRLGDVTAYNVPMALRLLDGTPAAKVEAALAELMRQHPLLHSRFAATDAGPERQIDEQATVPFEVVDLTDAAPADRVPAMIARSRRPFEMEGELLWRAVLYRWGVEQTALVLTFHHVICDGWSVSTLGRALAATLGGTLAETPSAEPAHDPIDQLVSEEEFYLCGREALSDLEFWKERLTPPPPPLILPHRRDEERAGEPPIHLQRVMLDGARLARVRAAAEACDVSLPAFLLGLYGLFLHRSLGNDDVAIGVITSLRIPSRHGETLAPLVNPVVVRSRFADRSSRARDFLVQTSNELRAALTHNRLPHAMLVEALRLPMIPGLPPLFQAAFGHIRVAGPIDEDANRALAAPARAVRPFLLHAQEGSNPLSLAWVESDEACIGEFAVHRAWMSEEATRRMCAQFDRLVDVVAADLEASIGTIPLLSDAERHRLEAWSQGPRAARAIAAEGETLHGLILAAAAQYPDLSAVIESDGTSWTYARLATESAALAAQLRALGLEPGDRVAVSMERSALWLASLLAILRAGGAFVPMDPQQPADRRAFMVADSDAKIVLAAAGTGADIAGGRLLFHPVNGQATEGAPALPTVAETAAAYVLYTSGSTGRPKGVAVSHAALRERLLWKVEAFEMTPQDRVLQSIPTIFDPSLWEIFTPLLCGAAVILAPPQTDREPVRIAALAQRHGITMFSCVSGVLSHLSDAFENQPPFRLRRVITGGEALTVAGRRRFQALTGAIVDHCYGPTEAAIFCTHLALPPSVGPAGDGLAAETAAIESVGRPVAGATIQVVDERGQPVPVGALGEIVIGGRGLAIGYLNRPEEDAARFVQLDGPAGGRFYRSGDSGRWRDDGCLEIVGRTDDQIKLRGVRIEPGEIEAVLLQAPGVKEAAVGIEQRATGPVLAAWVALAPNGSDEDVLDAYVRGRLPHALVPSIFHRVAKLPTLPSGKIDRNALAALTVASAPPSASVSASQSVRSVMEGHLLRLWRDLLQAPGLQPTDDVFQAGAHSLMVMRLIGRLHAETGRTVPAAIFFDRRTPRRQALLLDNEEPGDNLEEPTLKLLSPVPNGRNLVCIAAGIGDRVRLEHLAAALGNDITVWGLLPPGAAPDGKSWTVERLADAYAALVAEMLGANSCVMAGFSAGGPLAHEAACRLRRAGHAVDRVLLFDSAHPLLPQVNVAIFEMIRRGLGMLGHRSWLANSWLIERSRQIFDDRGLYIHLAALLAWRGDKFDGPLTIVRGSATRWISGILFRPWRHHARQVDYADARGLHGGLFHRRNVGGVAAIVRRLMIQS
ncbi:aspartate racemase [Aliidongia dinghuensis]|uniref:Aspartate racemase n=1 Tax=Aliidongia dinghuensis TaxID=1867774 RepID=A0A8J2YSV8_9PROT|nr:non-ribosomal peptide synthetase [Aliidongia dinghuensis]GGF10596.1 aspartate racemase [Aliidongia dinghuensis]